MLPGTADFEKVKVQVLTGEFKGESGHIMEKNKKKQEVTVQLDEAAGLQIVKLSMDDVCMIFE